MFKNPFLDRDGHDSVSHHKHCGNCELPIFNKASVLKDHLLCHWEHYGLIKYPEVIATDPETGKTIEGVIAIPSRIVIALIPTQTGLSFCIDCASEWIENWSKNGCAVCSDGIDFKKPYSRVETLVKRTDGVNANFQVYHFHHDCLSKHFHHVKEYQIKYGTEK